MNDNVGLKNSELCSISFFLMRYGFIGIIPSALTSIVYQDAWLAVLIGSIIGLIPILLFQYLRDYNHNLDFFDLSKHLFGKILGSIVNIIIILFITYISLMGFYNIVNFIGSQFLHRTPVIAISFVFILPIFYVLLKGVKIIGRSSVILAFITFTLIILSILGLLPKGDISNLQPFLELGLIETTKSSLLFIAFCVLPLIVIFSIPKNQIENNTKYNKTSIFFYITTSILITIITSIIILVLGSELTRLYQYPEFHVLKEVSLASFLNRVESILAMQWAFTFFIALSMNLFFIKKGILKLINKPSNILNIIVITILCLILIFFNNHIFANTTESNEFLFKTLPPIMIIILFVIPLIMFIVIKIKKKIA